MRPLTLCQQFGFKNISYNKLANLTFIIDLEHIEALMDIKG